MKQGIQTSIDWEFIGSSLANEGDEDQAKMLNAMAKEMLSWGTRYQAEMQMSSIDELLTSEARSLFGIGEQTK